LTMLYRSTDRLCRCGAPMKNLAHSASFESLDKNAPSKAGTKHGPKDGFRWLWATTPSGRPRRGPFFRPILDSLSGVRETNGLSRDAL